MIAPGNGPRGSSPRVLLVSTNRERSPQPVVPNGVACVASALAAAGHDVRVLDLCFASDPVAAARESVRALRPDVIGVSIRNIDNSDTIALRHYTPEAAAVLARAARRRPARSRARRWRGVRCRSRIALPGARRRLRRGRRWRAGQRRARGCAGGRPVAESVAGLVRRVGRPDRVHAAGRGRGSRRAATRARCAGGSMWPATSATARRSRFRPSAGCVYKCVYCTYRNVEGWGYRLRDPRAVAGEIAELRREAGRHGFRLRRFDVQLAARPCHRRVRGGRARRAPGPVGDHELHAGELLRTNCWRRCAPPASGPSASRPKAPAIRCWRGSKRASMPPGCVTVADAGVARRPADTVDFPDRRARRDAGRRSRKHWRSRPSRMRAGDAVYVTVGLRIYPGHDAAPDRARRRRGRLRGLAAGPDILFRRRLSIWPRPCVACAIFATEHPRFMFSADARSRLCATADTLRVARAAATPALALYGALPAHGACGSGRL